MAHRGYVLFTHDIRGATNIAEGAIHVGGCYV